LTIDLRVFTQDHTDQSSARDLDWSKFILAFFDLGISFSAVERPQLMQVNVLLLQQSRMYQAASLAPQRKGPPK
jgi:hypothetical protein